MQTKKPYPGSELRVISEESYSREEKLLPGSFGLGYKDCDRDISIISEHRAFEKFSRKDKPLRAKVLNKPAFAAAFGICCVLWLASCEKQNTYVEPPPPSVTVSRPVVKTVTDYLEFTGTTQAIASVDIRARVKGFLQSIHFKEGEMVKQGDLLYVIEPKTYQAAVDKAAADLESKKALLEKAEIEFQRNQRLIKENAASDREVVKSRTDRDSAKADLGVCAAALEDSKINLGYTTVRAPLSGRIGRNVMDLGNLVGAEGFTVLTTIKQYDPIYAYFTMNEHQLLKLRKKSRKDKSGELRIESLPVQLGLANEDDYPHEGRLDFSDLGVDPATGTILMRAVIPNPPPHVLVPGLFVRIRLPMGTRENALLVSERSVGSDQLGNYLLVVNNESIVEQRSVKLGTTIDGMRVVDEGLKADERIVSTALQKARPGAKIDPKEEKK